jgi:UDP-N-acetylglucosamine diphosphorylase / glucose-1-phosphate thymidylyltransferase / UDP-N-acetylgalactosamine diphosphorylase / glucosamine-1-phosphate N-acetyltransferase / galactosamine-1-phosphate N-acetyltransferase
MDIVKDKKIDLYASMDPNYYFSLENCPFSDLFQNCTYIWDVLKKLSLYLEKKNLGKIEVSIPSLVHLEDSSSISIGKGTIIEPGAYIKGPCWIGENCVIRHGAYIRGDVIVGNGSVIGHDTEVKHSILLDHAHAAHFNYIGDSILGNRTNLGAGVKCANFRLDQGEIPVHLDGKKIMTGLKKMGLILGDDSQIGCNSVTNPGTLMGKNVLCYPCLNIGGFVASKSKILPRQNYSIEAL